MFCFSNFNIQDRAAEASSQNMAKTGYWDLEVQFVSFSIHHSCLQWCDSFSKLKFHGSILFKMSMCPFRGLPCLQCCGHQHWSSDSIVRLDWGFSHLYREKVSPHGACTVLSITSIRIFFQVIFCSWKLPISASW